MSDSIDSLYPFLSDVSKNTVIDNDTLLESVKQKSEHSLSVKETFFSQSAQSLIDAAIAVASVYKKGGKMLTMGNGGSSCDAAHLAVEFQHPVTTGRPSLPAFNLSMDAAMTTAVANDVGVSHVFSRQLEAHARDVDCLVGFSTSGNSENIMSAFAKARELELITIGFAGGTGGEMKNSGLLDHCLVVESDSIHRVQEVHVACYHILWDLTHTLLSGNRGKLGQNKEPTQ